MRYCTAGTAVARAVVIREEGGSRQLMAMDAIRITIYIFNFVCGLNFEVNIIYKFQRFDREGTKLFH